MSPESRSRVRVSVSGLDTRQDCDSRRDDAAIDHDAVKPRILLSTVDRTSVRMPRIILYSYCLGAICLCICLTGPITLVSSFTYPRRVSARAAPAVRHRIRGTDWRWVTLHQVQPGDSATSTAESTKLLESETSLENPDKATTKIALFGMGCFWNPQQAFRDIPGVVQATVGYASQTKPDGGIPSYVTVCNGDGRTEAVLVEYSPEAVSYEQLLRTFWLNHDASVPSKAQYQSVIWPSTKAEREMAVKDIEQAATAYLEQAMDPPRTVVAEVDATSNFVPAESMHQNFWSKLKLKAAILAAATLIGSNGGTSSALTDSVTKAVVFLVLVWSLGEVRGSLLLATISSSKSIVFLPCIVCTTRLPSWLFRRRQPSE